MVALTLTLVQSNCAILIGSVLSGSARTADEPAAMTAILKTAALTAPGNMLFIFGLPVAPESARRCPVFTLDCGSWSLLGDRMCGWEWMCQPAAIPTSNTKLERSAKTNWSRDVEVASETVER